eukprot:322973_1
MSRIGIHYDSLQSDPQNNNKHEATWGKWMSENLHAYHVCVYKNTNLRRDGTPNIYEPKWVHTNWDNLFANIYYKNLREGKMEEEGMKHDEIAYESRQELIKSSRNILGTEELRDWISNIQEGDFKDVVEGKMDPEILNYLPYDKCNHQESA